MNQLTESSVEPDRRIVEVLSTLDGSGWVGFNAAGEPVQLTEADRDDVEVIDMLMGQRSPAREEPTDD